MKIRKMLLFSKAISVSYSFFPYQSKIIRVIELKKKRINFLFIAVIYFLSGRGYAYISFSIGIFCVLFFWCVIHRIIADFLQLPVRSQGALRGAHSTLRKTGMRTESLGSHAKLETGRRGG